MLGVEQAVLTLCSGVCDTDHIVVLIPLQKYIWIWMILMLKHTSQGVDPSKDMKESDSAPREMGRSFAISFNYGRTEIPEKRTQP